MFETTYPFAQGNFVGLPPVYYTADLAIYKQYPAVILQGTEALGVYTEQREVAGSLWQVVNATYVVGTGFVLANAAYTASCLVIPVGGTPYFGIGTAAGAGQFITWQFTQIGQPAGGVAGALYFDTVNIGASNSNTAVCARIPLNRPIFISGVTAVCASGACAVNIVLGETTPTYATLFPGVPATAGACVLPFDIQVNTPGFVYGVNPSVEPIWSASNSLTLRVATTSGSGVSGLKVGFNVSSA